jgi:hypothetical protein
MIARIIISILTFLTFLAALGFTVLGFIIGVPLLVVTCAALSFMVGIFSYYDLRYWINLRKKATIVIPTTKI